MVVEPMGARAGRLSCDIGTPRSRLGPPLAAAGRSIMSRNLVAGRDGGEAELDRPMRPVRATARGLVRLATGRRGDPLGFSGHRGRPKRRNGELIRFDPHTVPPAVLPAPPGDERAAVPC